MLQRDLYKETDMAGERAQWIYMLSAKLGDLSSGSKSSLCVPGGRRGLGPTSVGNTTATKAFEGHREPHPRARMFSSVSNTTTTT